MSSSGSTSSGRSGVAMTNAKANESFPNAKNVGFKDARLGMVKRPDGGTQPGIVITARDGSTVGFSLAVAQAWFTGTTRTKTIVTDGGKKKIVVTPAQMKKIETLVGKRPGAGK